MGDVRFVSETDAVKMLNISRTTIWRLRRAKEFPQRYRLSNGCFRYRESELISWCQMKIAA